jgi:preprotein translocase subunit SecG
MGFVIGLLSVFMVLDCAVLILLVLIQLPKKDAGAGLAFGGGATDALFGAGSGTVLTKITKYAAAIFFVMAIILSVMQTNYHNRRAATLQKLIGTTPRPAPGAMLPPAAAPTPTTAPSAAGTNDGKPIVEDPNSPLKLTTNTPTISTNPAAVPAPQKQ